MSLSDHAWMGEALHQAELAARLGEVPVGAVLVLHGEKVACAHNSPIREHDPTAHAEIRVLRLAGAKQGNYRLPGSTLYVTLEPCPMCIGAMIHARIQRLVFGAWDPRTGAAGSVLDLAGHHSHNHQLEVMGGVRADEAAYLLRRFFRQRRALKMGD